MAARWNSNLHAFELQLRHVPAGARTGLDVGCGEGETTRLRERVPVVVGLDVDGPSVAEARSHGDDIRYVLHHIDQREGLLRLAHLVRPGGLVLVVGVARSRRPRDFARDAVDAVALRRHPLFGEAWETPAPKVWPAPLTYAQTRDVSLEVLPGATYERLPFFRYGIRWTRPA